MGRSIDLRPGQGRSRVSAAEQWVKCDPDRPRGFIMAVDTRGRSNDSQKAVQGCADVEVEVFGSFKTGIYLPSSDIDIEVFGLFNTRIYLPSSDIDVSILPPVCSFSHISLQESRKNRKKSPQAPLREPPSPAAKLPAKTHSPLPPSLLRTQPSPSPIATALPSLHHRRCIQLHAAKQPRPSITAIPLDAHCFWPSSLHPHSATPASPINSGDRSSNRPYGQPSFSSSPRSCPSWSKRLFINISSGMLDVPPIAAVISLCNTHTKQEPATAISKPLTSSSNSSPEQPLPRPPPLLLFSPSTRILRPTTILSSRWHHGPAPSTCGDLGR
ncbi:uncharacterized protein LOC131166616 [Malania oleifera]|uniref:uncharacterized protein LOC131166616 n=1 Tax=Malania oleifera TaxID=397392 RepID=UPI0025AE24E6|nr:uncharacterized protein LOC131166616 [Malania oleifera]